MMNKEYRHIQDFLDDNSFVQWVLTGLGKDTWHTYLHENPEKRLLVEEARRLLLDIRASEAKTLPALDQQKVWDNIRQQLQIPEVEKKSSALSRRLYSVGAWAAGVVVVLGLSWLVWQRESQRTITYQQLATAIRKEAAVREVATGPDKSRVVVLEDGSVITLSKNSKLSYPVHFEANRRTVVLTGEAFFDIAKDPGRPFYIYANEVVTKVLGTSFRIQAAEGGNQVVVQVKTGRVSVYKQPRFTLTDPEADGIVLLPNQQVIYSRTQQNLSRRLVDMPLPVVAQPENKLLRYDEVPASKILRDIETQYGITILFNDDVLDHCILTTTLGDEPLHDKLDLICKTIGATYKEVDAQLIVESKGCR